MEYPLVTSSPEAIVIHCVDQRFQDAFNKFVVGEMGISVYVPIAIAGGALAISSDHISYFGYIWDQIDFFISLGVKKLVLINHDDCRWYQKEHPKLDNPHLVNKGRSDLELAVVKAKEKYPDIEVTAVWAEKLNSAVKFHIIK